MIDDGTCEVMGDEPIWAKVGEKDYGSIDKPHGFGAPRFDEEGKEIPSVQSQQDGEWRVIGWVTSGGFGHHVRASLAQGYIPNELSQKSDEGLFEIEILGVRRGAKIALEPLFDPTGKSMRA